MIDFYFDLLANPFWTIFGAASALALSFALYSIADADDIEEIEASKLDDGFIEHIQYVVFLIVYLLAWPVLCIALWYLLTEEEEEDA